MATKYQTATCQRCGAGFVLTPSYLDLLARRGAHVIRPVLCPTCFLSKGPMPKRHGRVKWFNPRKNYGFLVTEEGEDVFVHQHQIVDGNLPLSEGQEVRFHVRYPVKGPEALNVEVLEG